MDTLQGRHILVIHKEQYQWLWWVNKLFFFSILIFLIGNMNKIGFLIESKVKVKKKKKIYVQKVILENDFLQQMNWRF